MTCRICNGAPKKARCLFCGQKSLGKPKKDERAEDSQKFREKHLEYLTDTRSKLLKFRMRTTGATSVDEEVIKLVGDWRAEDRKTMKAIKAVNLAIDEQLEKHAVPTRSRTRALALQYGRDTTTERAVDEALEIINFTKLEELCSTQWGG